jgi:hypothetical protein
MLKPGQEQRTCATLDKCTVRSYLDIVLIIATDDKAYCTVLYSFMIQNTIATEGLSPHAS